MHKKALVFVAVYQPITHIPTTKKKTFEPLLCNGASFSFSFCRDIEKSRRVSVGNPGRNLTGFERVDVSPEPDSEEFTDNQIGVNLEYFGGPEDFRVV
jgi:hypothetical protein